MKLETPQVPLVNSSAWQAAMIPLAVLLALAFWSYSETWLAMASIWERSETFAHGWLIAPISLWLIWRNRDSLRLTTPQPTLKPLPLLLGLGVLWLLGNVAGAGVVQQYAFTLMIPVLVWMVLGTDIGLMLAFPLAYLVLAVPFGEVFLPAMMNFTADFTVWALRLTGIPVFREGLFFTIPSGQWSVVEACSGLRYLIASFTLGTLYAYLTYRTLRRRLWFTLASIVVPIVANGVRAYLIVLIGHVSGMTLAVGVDHLIYGWVFFGLVMLLLFWIGAYWREDDQTPAAGSAVATRAGSSPSKSHRFLPAFAAMLGVVAWPSYAAYLASHVPSTPTALTLPAPNGWQDGNTVPDWTPSYDNASVKINQSYLHGKEQGAVFIGYYAGSGRGKEMVSTGNGLVAGDHDKWTLLRVNPRQFPGVGAVMEAELRKQPTMLLVWQRYWVEGDWVANPYMAKWLQAKARLLGRPASSAVVMLSVPSDEDVEAARNRLSAFAAAIQPELDRSLARGG